jgi:protoporphyrin/coproporphyrin ferrochelatase
MPRVGVVLTNLGGPDTPEAIEPFLKNLFSDPLILSFGPGFFRRFVARRIAKKRAPKVAKDYATIGGASPLVRLTDAQARGLEAILEQRAPGRFAVAVAMRYWKPFTEEAVVSLRTRGCERFLHLPLYPQESEATTESSSRELRRVLATRDGASAKCHEVATNVPDSVLAEIRGYHLHAGYLAALRRTIDEGLATLRASGARSPHVLFSAHGLPQRFEKRGDPYVGQIKATRDAVAAGLTVPTTLSFQSRVGPVAWVKPYTDETILRLASEGCKDLLVVPLGFVSDHFETLFEIDRLYGDLAKSHGVERFMRAPSLNDRPDFLETLADLVLSRPA